MLIPDNISDFNSIGEKILYLKFKNDKSTDNMYVLHSLFTNHHVKNISGELDFFVLAPNHGFFSIEVKHGGISRKNGQWCFTDRDGKTTCKNTGPFVQQSATINSIRKYVLKKMEHKKELHDRFSKILWGSGVAFTSMMEFVDFGPEGHSWQVLTKQGLNLPIASFITSISNGSHRESSGKFWYDVHNSRPSKSDCEYLVKLLRGDFEINYPEVNKINDSEFLIEEYTKEQFHLLDFVKFNPRCLIQGAAGTGKTLMALELFKRNVTEGLKVGLFCYNKLLAEILFSSSNQSNLGFSQSNFCGTLHSFLVQSINDVKLISSTDSPNFFSEDLPLEFLINNECIPEEEKFDFIILDEAQDLISPYYLEVFDLILKGGIKNGRWAMFGDFSNQAIYLNNPTETLSLLNSRANFTSFPPLKINCRNTKEITTNNTLLTGVELPETTLKNVISKSVTYKYPSKSDRKEVLLGILQEIERKKIPMDKVTLLSPKKLEHSYLKDDFQIIGYIDKGLKSSTIQGYKGLENSIIILFDFEDVTSDQMQRLLYVGISRARQQLFLVFDQSQIEPVKNLTQENAPKILQ